MLPDRLLRAFRALRGSAAHFALALALLAVELFIALRVRDGLVRPYLGDTLVVVLIYCALASVLRADPRRLAAAVLLLAYTVEVLQAWDYVALLHLEQHRVLAVMLGRTFQWGDFVAYAAGYCLVLAGERCAQAQGLRKRSALAALSL